MKTLLYRSAKGQWTKFGQYTESAYNDLKAMGYQIKIDETKTTSDLMTEYLAKGNVIKKGQYVAPNGNVSIWENVKKPIPYYGLSVDESHDISDDGLLVDLSK